MFLVAREVHKFPTALVTVMGQITGAAVLAQGAVCIGDKFVSAGALEPIEWTGAEEAVELLRGAEVAQVVAREEFALAMAKAHVVLGLDEVFRLHGGS